MFLFPLKNPFNVYPYLKEEYAHIKNDTEASTTMITSTKKQKLHQQ